MGMVEKEARLYAWKTNYVKFHIVSGEANSRTLRMQLHDAVRYMNLTGYQVMFYSMNRNFEEVYVPCEVVAPDTGIVSVTVPLQIGTDGEEIPFWIQVIGPNGEDLRFDGMTLEVSGCSLEGQVESPEFAMLASLIAEARPAIEKAKNAASVIQDAKDAAAEAKEAAKSANFQIVGRYASLELLKTSHPVGEIGQAFAVGTETSNTVYIWGIEVNDWVNIGPIQGAKGEKGDRGVGIKSIERTDGDGSPGTTDTYTITFTDDQTMTYCVTHGKNGADGKDSTGADQTLNTGDSVTFKSVNAETVTANKVIGAVYA